MQKNYYKWILTREADKLGRGGRGVLANTVMQLRKCCNHPYLFDGAEPMQDGEYINGPHVITNSGKMQLLDNLLQELRASGHRALIFSQMTRMLVGVFSLLSTILRR
jgi:SNF2 family DNA or RNA helicase